MPYFRPYVRMYILYIYCRIRACFFSTDTPPTLRPRMSESSLMAPAMSQSRQNTRLLQRRKGANSRVLAPRPLTDRPLSYRTARPAVRKEGAASGW